MSIVARVARHSVPLLTRKSEGKWYSGIPWKDVDRKDLRQVAAHAPGIRLSKARGDWFR